MGSDLRIQKTTGALVTNLSKSYLEDSDNINKYRSFVGQLMSYSNKIGPDVVKAERDLAMQMIHPGTEHWKALGLLIGYLKGK